MNLKQATPVVCTNFKVCKPGRVLTCIYDAGLAKVGLMGAQFSLLTHKNTITAAGREKRAAACQRRANARNTVTAWLGRERLNALHTLIDGVLENALLGEE